jgi:UDP-N-acetylmuramate dehydrogenase
VDRLVGELKQLFRGDIFLADSLDRRTTYRIGGPAKLLVCPKDIEDLQRLNSWIKQHAVPKFVLGGGANVLVSDQGFEEWLFISPALTH